MCHAPKPEADVFQIIGWRALDQQGGIEPGKLATRFLSVNGGEKGAHLSQCVAEDIVVSVAGADEALEDIRPRRS